MAKRPNDSDGPGTAEYEIPAEFRADRKPLRLTGEDASLFVKALETERKSVYFTDPTTGEIVTLEIAFYRPEEWNRFDADHRSRWQVSAFGSFLMVSRLAT